MLHSVVGNVSSGQAVGDLGLLLFAIFAVAALACWAWWRHVRRRGRKIAARYRRRVTEAQARPPIGQVSTDG